jgi:hypothetical protein
VPILHCSHFEAIPTTCFHNVLTEEDGLGDMADYFYSSIVAPEHEYPVRNFARGGEEVTNDMSVVIREANQNGSGLPGLEWGCGYDFTTAPAIQNAQSHFTKKDCSFLLMTRPDYSLMVGQKIGMAIYRDFDISCFHAGMPRDSLTDDELNTIYGRGNRVNIYTGWITAVSPGGNCFEHNVNSFRGCSGAIIFLLDRQDRDKGVIEEDYGKAIAVHVGGKNLGEGQRTNVAFRIPRTMEIP